MRAFPFSQVLSKPSLERKLGECLYLSRCFYTDTVALMNMPVRELDELFGVAVRSFLEIQKSSSSR